MKEEKNKKKNKKETEGRAIQFTGLKGQYVKS